MPGDDLLELARSGTDYYALLSTPENALNSASTESDLKRAYRRAALLHHPDKHPDDPNAATRFHALQVAHDILNDPEAKFAFDSDQAARQRKRDQGERLDGRRKAFAEELLKAELGESEVGKRKRDEESHFQTELQRIAADGARRRRARADALRKVAEKEKDVGEDTKVEDGKISEHGIGGENVPEISRTVKIRFSREGLGVAIDETRLRKLMTKFGDVSSVIMLKDRKIRPANDDREINLGNAAVMFSSIVSAHLAVEDYKEQSGSDWALVDKIDWAQGKEPEFLSSSTTANSPGKATPRARSNIKLSPATVSAGPSPNLEELTFMRLKKAEQRKAEKRKLEEQMRRQEAESGLVESTPEI